jgi:hypothetical protein
MGYSIHIPLGFGIVKIKSSSHLRPEEHMRRVPIMRFGNMFIVWKSRAKRAPDFGAAALAPSGQESPVKAEQFTIAPDAGQHGQRR